MLAGRSSTCRSMAQHAGGAQSSPPLLLTLSEKRAATLSEPWPPAALEFSAPMLPCRPRAWSRLAVLPPGLLRPHRGLASCKTQGKEGAHGWLPGTGRGRGCCLGARACCLGARACCSTHLGAARRLGGASASICHGVLRKRVSQLLCHLLQHAKEGCRCRQSAALAVDEAAQVPVKRAEQEGENWQRQWCAGQQATTHSQAINLRCAVPFNLPSPLAPWLT